MKIIQDHLRDSGFDVPVEGVKFKWQPGAEDLDSCQKFGLEMGQATKKKQPKEVA